MLTLHRHLSPLQTTFVYLHGKSRAYAALDFAGNLLSSLTFPIFNPQIERFERSNTHNDLRKYIHRNNFV